jgi:2-amino-4-hydroxy-6-hydroxymethyldihydropteridine diphosphokinase
VQSPLHQHALVALGANLPFAHSSPPETISAALGEIVANGLEIVAKSRLFATPCFPAGAGPDYVNAACVIDSAALDPASILAVLHEVEDRFGRRRAQRWGMRTLDLDLLAFGDSILPDPQTHAAWAGLAAEDQVRRTPDGLILPHPRLQDRAFVLVPLMDVAPDWRHPVTGRTVSQMCAALPAADRDAVVPLA